MTPTKPKSPPTREDAEELIREAVEEGRVKFFPSDIAEAFGSLPDEFLLRVLGIPNAWISDASELSDFGAKTEATYAKIESEYGVDVRGKDKLIEIFRIIASRTSFITH